MKYQWLRWSSARLASVRKRPAVESACRKDNRVMNGKAVKDKGASFIGAGIKRVFPSIRVLGIHSLPAPCFWPSWLRSSASRDPQCCGKVVEAVVCTGGCSYWEDGARRQKPWSRYNQRAHAQRQPVQSEARLIQATFLSDLRPGAATPQPAKHRARVSRSPPRNRQANILW